MSNIYVEGQDGRFVAIKNDEIVARGHTQYEVIDKVRQISHDPILARRVRKPKSGSAGSWRRV